MSLGPTYKIEEGPSAMPVEEYSNLIEARFRSLIDGNPSESDVQTFLEHHPALVPGARTVGTPSGHAPLNNALITQPRLPGLRSKVPDFMWIAFHSKAWFPTLIEVERPDKKIFKADGVPRAEFTQALNQLSQWRAWFRRPENILTFTREYGVPEAIEKRRSMILHMILIYGRRSEFESDPTMSNQRSSLVTGNDEELMSFDRLVVDKELRDAITVRCTDSGKYTAVGIPSTFTLGPTFAHRLLHIAEFATALRKADIESERLDFLIRRLEYWRDWAKNGNVGIIRGGDRE